MWGSQKKVNFKKLLVFFVELIKIHSMQSKLRKPTLSQDTQSSKKKCSTIDKGEKIISGVSDCEFAELFKNFYRLPIGGLQLNQIV